MGAREKGRGSRCGSVTVFVLGSADSRREPVPETGGAGAQPGL